MHDYEAETSDNLRSSVSFSVKRGTDTCLGAVVTHKEDRLEDPRAWAGGVCPLPPHPAVAVAVAGSCVWRSP